ncbi:MAG: hypothetical protein CMF13_02970 [Idiomarina sp.]|nr:hypothetical protein [Pelagibaca sp.]MBR37312.1 hypothetical protein [Idiomarina sp.]
MPPIKVVSQAWWKGAERGAPAQCVAGCNAAGHRRSSRRFGLGDLEPRTEMPVVDDRIALIEPVEKQADGDLLRKVLGVSTGPSEAETFWADLLHSLAGPWTSSDHFAPP